ncbi:MAG: hypothetical protein SNJ67_00640, partial [Chloracidobacterium sp.]
LYQEIADLTVTAQEQAEKEGRGAQFAQTFLPARDRVIATLLSLGFLFRQYIRRESLDDLLADVRRRFDGTIAKQPHPNERDVNGKLSKPARPFGGLTRCFTFIGR